MGNKLTFLKREYVDQYLYENPCIDCGEQDILVLDFDHNPRKGLKVNNISTMIKDKSSLEELKAEIDKCEVRCANDHRRRHRLEERGLEI